MQGSVERKIAILVLEIILLAVYVKFASVNG